MDGSEATVAVSKTESSSSESGLSIYLSERHIVMGIRYDRLSLGVGE